MDKDRIKAKITDYYLSHDEYYDKLETVFSDRAEKATKIGSLDIMDYAKGSHSILDVGCGTGALLRRIKQRFPDTSCCGVDLSPIAVEKAVRISSEAGYDITFAVADMEKECPFPAASFDLILAHEVLEHFVHPDLVLKNIGKLLKKDGIAVVIAPNHFIRASWKIKLLKAVDFVRMVLDEKYLNITIIDPPLNVTGGDSDAVYITNPWELHRMAKNAGMAIVRKSLLKCRLVAKKPS